MNAPSPWKISIRLDSTVVEVDRDRIRAAVSEIMAEAGLKSAQVGIAVIDDGAIQQMNRQFLNHDYATDVLSFTMHRSATAVEGQIAVSAETAQREAADYGWPAADELLLYIVHGALHLVGYNDKTPSDAAAMRQREREVLAGFGLNPPWDEEAVEEEVNDQ
ncbi:MAG: rRNA maturation RNase YbeY [Planctomycetia bacterium]|nr:rRNA maturation RNase YbeY [Planctomycetia bacterium]